MPGMATLSLSRLGPSLTCSGVSSLSNCSASTWPKRSVLAPICAWSGNLRSLHLRSLHRGTVNDYTSANCRGLDWHTAQGNRVLTEEDFEQVVLPPAGLEPFALDSHLQAGLVFKQIVGNLPQQGHVLWRVVPCFHEGRLLRTRHWSSPKATSRVQCSEFSMPQ